MIKPISVTLFTRSSTSTDDFGRPIYTETSKTVDGVLVAPLSEDEVLETLNLTGRRAVYQLGLPKGDTNDWTDKHVQFFGEDWRVIGMPLEGIEANIPLKWNKKIKVERYE